LAARGNIFSILGAIICTNILENKINITGYAINKKTRK
jgi:hypothetical protein